MNDALNESFVWGMNKSKMTCTSCHTVSAPIRTIPVSSSSGSSISSSALLKLVMALFPLLNLNLTSLLGLAGTGGSTNGNNLLYLGLAVVVLYYLSQNGNGGLGETLMMLLKLFGINL